MMGSPSCVDSKDVSVARPRHCQQPWLCSSRRPNKVVTKYALGLSLLQRRDACVILHAYWRLHDPAAVHTQSAMFWENVSMLGGAILIAQFGGGPISVDAAWSRSGLESQDYEEEPQQRLIRGPNTRRDRLGPACDLRSAPQPSVFGCVQDVGHCSRCRGHAPGDLYSLATSRVEEEIRSPRAFLVTIVSRLCINHLQSARVQREEYVGQWLPEPIVTDPANDPLSIIRVDESLSMAFLVLMERLTPVERAVFLLREVFEYEYAEIAAILGQSEANCRQILRRSRQHVSALRPRFKYRRRRRVSSSTFSTGNRERRRKSTRCRARRRCNPPHRWRR